MERTGETKAKGWNRGRDKPLGPTGALITLMMEKGGANGWGQRQQKRSYGAGLQGPRGTLGSRSRAARKRIAETGVGGRREWAMSRWTVNQIPEERVD